MDPVLGACELSVLRQRRSFKWTKYPAEILPAFVAEMDFDVAEAVTETIAQAARAGDCGYPGTAGPGAAYSAWAHRSFGWAPHPSHVVAIPDVMTGIAEVLLATTSPGSGVVINPPVYPPFSFRPGFVGRRVVQAPLARQPSGRYDIDLDALDQALAQPGVEAYLLCSPHNPLGRVWTRQELTQVADLCVRHQTLLLVDEIHAPLTLGEVAHTPFGSLDHQMAVRAFTFTSGSKGWNIAGMKCGLAVVGNDEAAALLEARSEALLPSHHGVLATIAAFSAGDAWLSAARLQLAANSRLLAELLASHLPGVGYVAPEASFLAWLDCRRLGLGDDPAAAFLAKGQVALQPGPEFGTGGAGHTRLNFGTSPELLTEIVKRMAAALGYSS